MHPTICTIGPLTIYSYGFMLAWAFALSMSLAGFRAKKENIDPEIVFNFSFFVLIAGILGARIFYVIEHFDFYRSNPLEIIMLQHGGLSFFGGLFLGTISGIAYLKVKKIGIYKILDLIAPFAALAQAIGRIGCFLNGCCGGKEDALIPVQLAASMLLILIFIILRFLQDRPHKAGQVFYSYLFLYDC